MGFPPKIICPNPNCGYKGHADEKAKASSLTQLVLLALALGGLAVHPVMAIITGAALLIYSCQGKILFCPKCKVQVQS